MLLCNNPTFQGGNNTHSQHSCSVRAVGNPERSGDAPLDFIDEVGSGIGSSSKDVHINPTEDLETAVQSISCLQMFEKVFDELF